MTEQITLQDNKTTIRRAYNLINEDPEFTDTFDQFCERMIQRGIIQLFEDAHLINGDDCNGNN